jgi:glucose-1-phosphate cytidylyltransferase
VEKIPVVILCGGQGTRIRGESLTKKELIQIGNRPIIWHVMRIFSAYGHNHFILTLGHLADQMKRYFLEYDAMMQDFSLELGCPSNNGESHTTYHGQAEHPPWHVTLVDTGLNTEKASRIARVAPHIAADRFFVSYGDDVSDVNLTELLRFHRAHGKMATITAIQTVLQYGVVEADESGLVTGFVERPRLPYWINGGFMLFEHSALALMADGDNVNLETEVLPRLVREGQLMIYRHTGFWQSMNTMKDNLELEQIWQNEAPWKVW